MDATVMKKLMGMQKGCDMEQEEKESPEESSLADLIAMLEEVIANKGKAKKQPMEMSVTMVGKPEDGKQQEEEDEKLKSKLFG